MAKRNRSQASSRVCAEILEEFHRYPGPKRYQSGEPIPVKLRIESVAGLKPEDIELDTLSDGLISVLVFAPPNAEVVRADYEVTHGRFNGEVWVSCFDGLYRA